MPRPVREKCTEYTTKWSPSWVRLSMLLIVSFSFKVLCKRDAAQEAEIQRWIEAVLGENFPPGKPFEDCLKDGIMLCRLMNKLEPGIVPKINESGPSFKMMENVNRFHQALIKYGVKKGDIFQTNDLSEKKDIANVVNTLCALGRAVKQHSEWTGPMLSVE